MYIPPGLSVFCDEALYVGAPVAHVCLLRERQRIARKEAEAREAVRRHTGSRFGRAVVWS